MNFNRFMGWCAGLCSAFCAVQIVVLVTQYDKLPFVALLVLLLGFVVVGVVMAWESRLSFQEAKENEVNEA